VDCEGAEEALASLLDANSHDLLIQFRNCKACHEFMANLFLVRVMARIAREQWGTEKSC
jgi:hypothetical protein